MKKILTSFLVLAAISFTACKDNKKTDDAKTPGKMEEAKPAVVVNDKDHVCTDKCKDGNHIYAHGEKGHTCTEACSKM